MRDLLGECNEFQIPEPEFRRMFCIRCKNDRCTRSRKSGTKWEDRMATQVDRLLVHPNFAEETDSKYEHIREQDFPMMLREAIRLHVAEKKGDWSIPTESDLNQTYVHFGVLNPETPSDPQSVDEALRTLDAIKGVAKPEAPKVEDPVPETMPEIEAETDTVPQNPPLPVHFAMNNEVLFVGEESKIADTDPWAPKKKVEVAEKGARIKMGG